MASRPFTPGHRPRFDERSREYGVRMLAPRPPRSWTWRCATYLDQGAVPACTGFSMAHDLAARPKPLAVTKALAMALYREAQKLDQWEGEGYEGSSVLGAAKAARAAGKIREYRWCFGEPDVAVGVSWIAPVVIGIPWTEGMMEPDKRGVIRPTGADLGGHAILVKGLNTRTNLYRFHGSWGTSWGFGGDCFISREDLAALLRRDGEACVPVKA